MQYDEFKLNLIEALKDPMVQEAMKKIKFAPDNKETEFLKSECERYKKEVQDNRTQIRNLMEQNNDLKSIINKTKTEKKEADLQLQEINKKLAKFHDKFNTLTKMYFLYEEISGTAKTALKGIFKEDEPAAWVAAGILAENIDSLWEYTRMQIMNRQFVDLDKLTQIIYYFIDLCNKNRNIPLYKMQNVHAGDMFDVELHIRTSNSRAAGKINRVILYGYQNANLNGIIKKSVVEVN